MNKGDSFVYRGELYIFESYSADGSALAYDAFNARHVYRFSVQQLKEVIR